MQTSVKKKAFQTEGITRAKSLRRVEAWCMCGAERELAWWGYPVECRRVESGEVGNRHRWLDLVL